MDDRTDETTYHVTLWWLPTFQTVAALGYSTGGTKTSRGEMGTDAPRVKRAKRVRKKVVKVEEIMIESVRDDEKSNTKL